LRLSLPDLATYFCKTFAPNAAFYAKTKNITREQTETNAYKVSAKVAHSWGPDAKLSYGDCGQGPCVVFTGNMAGKQLDRAIAKLLEHTLKPDELKHVIVPRWAP
jgi:hypothetical protein